MKPDTPLAQLRYFLQDDLYLLKADQDIYRNPPLPQPAIPVVAAQMPNNSITTPAVAFKYLGGNQKSFLVLCHYPAEDFMPQAHLTALTNTVVRIQVTQPDMALVNLAHYPKATWPQLLDFFSVKKLLVLGIDALPAGLPELNLNEAQTIDEYQALYTFSFNEMIGQKENTKAFWNQIKTF